MIKFCLIAIVVLLYFWIGINVFYFGIRCVGGKENYIRMINEDHPESNPYIVYVIAKIIVILGWPYFIIGGFLHK